MTGVVHSNSVNIYGMVLANYLKSLQVASEVGIVEPSMVHLLDVELAEVIGKGYDTTILLCDSHVIICGGPVVRRVLRPMMHWYTFKVGHLTSNVQQSWQPDCINA